MRDHATSPWNLVRPALLLGLALALAGCALFEPRTVLPSAPPPIPGNQDRRDAALLLREGQRALNPPRGVAPDPDRAALLIEAAATRGDADAQMLVAASHLSRPDGGRDPAAALPWLHRAAQQGHADAQFRLGQLLEAGEGTRRDVAWAAVWLQRAGERGHAPALFAIALLQVAGEGTARDEAEALARLTLAEAGGVAAARRYAAALRGRVPPAQARAATARLRGERSRGAVVTPDRPLARFVQSGLARLGAWPGPVDGRDSPATRAALLAFARQEGLAAAGPYDPAVLDRLRERLAAR
jgi:hypothetical protein